MIGEYAARARVRLISRTTVVSWFWMTSLVIGSTSRQCCSSALSMLRPPAASRSAVRRAPSDATPPGRTWSSPPPRPPPDRRCASPDATARCARRSGAVGLRAAAYTGRDASAPVRSPCVRGRQPAAGSASAGVRPITETWRRTSSTGVSSRRKPYSRSCFSWKRALGQLDEVAVAESVRDVHRERMVLAGVTQLGGPQAVDPRVVEALSPRAARGPAPRASRASRSRSSGPTSSPITILSVVVASVRGEDPVGRERPGMRRGTSTCLISSAAASSQAWSGPAPP